MHPTDKTTLRQKIRLLLNGAVDTLQAKSLLICDRLMSIDTFRYARQNGRLMSFVSMSMEIDTVPLFSGNSMIVPCCEANEIVPIRILSLDELEPSGNLKILEPKLTIRQDASRRVLPEQIDVVLVPGLAFDRFGNRLGRGKGYYDRFLRRLSDDVLTIGLALDVMVRELIPHDDNDCPVKMVVTESQRFTKESISSLCSRMGFVVDFNQMFDV
jgi:5-formyltetrahydrofolate cyclo-ligase